MQGISSSFDLRRLALTGALLSWCLALLAFRILKSVSFTYLFLAWNLFLACVPLAAAIALRKADERRLPLIVRAACFALWLLFLPNAPYVLTDVQHLRP